MDDQFYPQDDDHVVAVFFQAWLGTDWLSTIWVRDGVTMAAYRFRYHSEESADPFDGKDRKSWYTLSTEESPESVVSAMEFIAEASRGFNAPLTEDDLIMVNGTTKKMMELMSQKDWCHMRPMSPDGHVLDD